MSNLNPAAFARVYWMSTFAQASTRPSFMAAAALEAGPTGRYVTSCLSAGMPQVSSALRTKMGPESRWLMTPTFFPCKSQTDLILLPGGTATPSA